MPLDQELMEELKANIAAARKRELAFGLCIGKAAETTVLVCHKTKDPETLGRQAKKDGETAKVTFGMMTVEGKNLNLSCQGDIPAGIARKTREMLKLANLKLKVRILDPLGNAVEEDGDEEEDGDPEGGPAADPLAEDWAVAKAETQPRVVAAQQRPEGQGILSDWQAAVGLADRGDLRGGLNALEALNRKIDEAEANAGQADADKARWEQSRPKLEAAVRDAIARKTPASAKVKVAWDFMLGKANANPPDYAAAVKAISTLVALIQQVRTEAPPQPGNAPAAQQMAEGRKGGQGGTKTATPPTGGAQPQPQTRTTPQQGQPQQAQQPQPQPQAQGSQAQTLEAPAKDAPDKERFDYAEALLKQTDAAIDTYMALIPGSAEARPANWVATRGKIDGVLAPMRGAAAKIDGARVANVIKVIEVLAGVIKTKSDEKSAWKTTLDLVTTRLVPIDRHPEAGTEPQVKPKITAIRADLAKAVGKADTQDFKGAQSTAQPLLARCDTVEKLEDDLAHYNSILAQRQWITTALGDETKVKEVDNLKAAILKLYADATKLAGKDKFGEAIAKLDQMPALHDQFRRLWGQGVNYKASEKGIADRFVEIDRKMPAILAPFTKQIEGWKADFEKAKFPKTKDYAASARGFDTVWGLICPGGWLDKEMTARQDFLAAKALFEAKFREFEAHKGRAGIEDFFQQMDRDRTQAQAEGISGKFTTATAIMKRTENQWPAQKTLADDCEAYIAKRDPVAKTISDLKGKAGAEAGVAEAEALMASARSQFQAKDFKAAKLTVEEAERRAAAAKAGSDAKTDLDGAKNTDALNAISANIDAAIGVYTAVRAKVAGRATGNTFAADFARADLEAKKASDEKAKPAPNFATARQGLDAGIAILEGLLPKIMAKAGYDAQLQEVKGFAQQLPGKSPPPDNCIQTRITRINQAIAAAETAARPPGLDFPGACSTLTRAREDCRKALADADLWPQIKADRQIIETAKTNINADPSAAAIMGPTLTKLDAAMTAVDTKKNAEDFKAAAALAKSGAAEATKTAADLLTAQSIVSRHDWWYDRKVGPGVGKIPGPNGATKAASQINRLNAKHGLYLAALAAGNYDAANGLMEEVYWAIEAAERILAEFDTYEVARVAAEAKVNALKLVRNAGVEEEVKKIETRYAAAVALSNNEKHKPAEALMLKLPADCGALILKAADWKAYDDALLAATTKLTAMETHAQAVAIRPATTALRGKLTGAIATASKGDFKSAKTLLDTIPGEADAALNAANAAGSVITKAGQVGGGAIDPALLAEAQTLYDQLAQNPQAASAKADLDIAKTRINIAKDSKTKPEDAKTALKNAMEACTRAQVTISQMDVIKAAIITANAELATLKTHAQAAYIAPEIGVIEKELTTVETDAAKSGPDVVGNRIRGVEERCAAAKVLANKHKEYLDLRAKPEVEPRLAQLETHDHRFAVKPRIDAFRKKLDEAAKLSAAKNPAGALSALEEARSMAQSAWVEAEMRADRKPSVSDVAAVINAPGGDKAFDEMFKLLEPNAQREVIKVAFQARFGVQLTTFTGVDATGAMTTPLPDGAPGVLDGPDLKRFYDVMIKLPKDHVVNNDSMRKFTSGKQHKDGGSLYKTDTKEVVMREGDAALSYAYGFGQEHEVGGADEDCQPANDEEVTYFSWNTMHEVGHAVDDKLSYMARNGTSDTHGGWTEHVKDTQTIAAAVAPHFKYDVTYIGQYLSKATPPIPPKPDNCSEEEWDARRVAVEAWAKTAFETNKPWTSNSSATKLAINGIVYQESYTNSWTSYKIAARKQGMTGYQFRAPGEWFAELYAAFHSKKLKPTHPAYGWLSAL